MGAQTKDTLQNEYFQGSRSARPHSSGPGSSVRARKPMQTGSMPVDRQRGDGEDWKSTGTRRALDSRRASGSMGAPGGHRSSTNPEPPPIPKSSTLPGQGDRSTKVIRNDKSAARASANAPKHTQDDRPARESRPMRESRPSSAPRRSAPPPPPPKRITKRLSTMSASSRVDGIGLDEDPHAFTSWVFTPHQRSQYLSHESVLDALAVAEGPFVHMIKWGRMEFKPLLNATRNFHEFAIFCGERAVSRERKAGRNLDPICNKILRLKGRWICGQADDSELEAMREQLLVCIEKTRHPASRQAVKCIYYATSRTEIWKFASKASQESAEVAAWGAGWLTERKLQNDFLKRSIFESQEKRVQANPECGVWSILEEVEVVPCDWA